MLAIRLSSRQAFVGLASSLVLLCAWMAALPARAGTADTGGAASDQPPVVTTPASVSWAEGSTFSFIATATDPDGDTIDRLRAFFLPSGATFTADGSNTSGLFQWTPDYDQAGVYQVEIAAESACRPVTVSREACAMGAAFTTITVTNRDRAPTIDAPASIAAVEGVPFSVRFGAGDPDGEALTSFTASSLPAGATFTPADDLSYADLAWTPDPGQAGDYTIVFAAANALSAVATTLVSVTSPPRPPAVAAPSAVNGIEESPLAFTATASDPDGDAIEALTASPIPAGASFTANATNTSGTFAWTPAKGQAGRYDILLSASSACRAIGVSGAPICDVTTATTTVTVASAGVPARAYLTNANRTIRLGSGKPAWCAELEPVAGAFAVGDILPGTVAMSRIGGAGRRLLAVGGKSRPGADHDRNGIEDVEVCFEKDSLRTFFADLPRGETRVEVVFVGDLAGGGSFESGPVAVDVIAKEGGAVVARVAPNPMNPEATLEFATERAGRARVSLYDSQGRLVRRVLDAATLPAGEHRVRIRGTNERGVPLPSGVYFYRVESADGSAAGRLVVAK